MNQCNELTPKVTLNGENNAKSYKSHNALPRRAKAVYKRAYNICETEQRPFCYVDFPSISKGNFRQTILLLRDFIEPVGKGRPQFYKIKGVDLPGTGHSITHRDMRGTKEVVDILENLREQPAKIHDIKIKFESDLHSKLVESGASVNPSNHSISVNCPYLNNNITTRIQIYPTTVQIDIGCTFRPIVYDTSGIYYLLQHLAEIRFYLLSLSSFKVTIPDVYNWIFTHWHMGRDGTEEINGQSFHYRWEDVANGIITYYSKKMPNGMTIARAEKIQTPQKPGFEIINEILEAGQ